ncbi:hypothetical protein AAMO2058_000301700 [Amorphochlora amoebiformis]
MSCPFGFGAPKNPDAFRSEVRSALINKKVNACPIAMRLAWHASGTYQKSDNTGGSDGATMRFEPEITDGANAGLTIPQDLLLPVKKKHPEVSQADIWTYAGKMAIEETGGPVIPFSFGRIDEPDGKKCPANGRLPDASLGAKHLRDVFYRMGFDDRGIVALSGGHTLGRCHKSRSGFDGPWTADPLTFNNAYYKDLLTKTWVERKWEGPLQYEDKETGKQMMLPTDIALIKDEKFKAIVAEYAKSQEAFYKDFAEYFGKLISLGVPQRKAESVSEKEKKNREFRELCMHGSTERAKAIAKDVDVKSAEPGSGRTGLHKAAFWGHQELTSWLVGEMKMNPDDQDYAGDTALMDAAKFGHTKVVESLLKAGADKTIKNKEGKTAGDIAKFHDKKEILALL